MCVCAPCVYICHVYINTHTCMYIFQKICYAYILHLLIYNTKYMNLNIDIIKNAVCVCIYKYIRNKYTQNTHIYYANKTFIFFY